MSLVAERERKKTDKASERKPNRQGRAINVWLSDDLDAALEAYLGSLRPSPKVSDTVRAALEDFLRSRGFWPRKPD